MAMATHGIGIIGLGFMGKRMAAAMAAHPRFRLVGAYDPAPAGVAGIKIFASPGLLAADPAVDCIYVAAPPAQHLTGVRLAVAAGKPIFCEKPLAGTVAEAKACVEAVEKAGIPAAVNFYYAASDPGVRLRRVVASGALGEIRSAHLTLRFKTWPRSWQSAAGAWLAQPQEGGFTREVGSHFLFLAQRLFGPGRRLDSRIERGPAGTERSLQARIGYRDVVLAIDGAVGGEIDDHNHLEIVGSKGRVALVDWDALDYAGSEAGAPLPESSMLDSLAAMLEGGAHELARMEEAAAVVELTEALLA
jgi:predicted dehydrogenase